MTITINGVRATVDEGARVTDAVGRVLADPARRGVAVAVNGEVVPRSAWSTTGLSPGDRVEVLTAAQGG
ncbi:sulfur carrier protein ThiS [Rhizomonospora bruguierae]|uniref:sulfur carrier protein ThiS n=1 Tax=Rhizomonospora bruguierae TaxID=1581705 RepID=UPI001BCDA9EC|nr:sulfur carrier protein ThiS [Micromonospora sp. NBRC 107566]